MADVVEGRTVRSDVPTANWMPTKVASSGTGAVALRLSGPVTAACARPSRSQNTRPHVSVATAVISVTRSLRHVHTEWIHGESDARVSSSNGTGRDASA